MKKQNNDNKKIYQKWWVWVIGIFLLLWLKQKSDNPISPVLFIAGIIAIIFGGTLLWKNLADKNTEEQPYSKEKIKHISIILIVGIILSITGFSTLSFDSTSIREKEKLISNVTFKGLDENSSPLAASDLKLFKKGNTYTIVTTLKKNSTEPKERYFEFDICFADKNGKYIDTEHISTIPSSSYSSTDMPLFTNGSNNHFEQDIYISSKEKPIVIEFTNIKEFDKEHFIMLTIEKIKQSLNNQYFDQARKYVEEILEYDPNNEEVKKLLQQANPTEHSYTPTPATESPKQEQNVIIGSNKNAVRKLFNSYKETKSIMSDNALDFENNDLLVTVYFNGENKADGVLFMQNSFDGVDTLTGEGSYISKHYDELVAMATKDSNIKVETDVTKYNSQGVKKYPMEIYIGNIPESKPKSTENTDSGYAQFNPETGHFERVDDNPEPKQQSSNTETKPKSEFSYCLTSGIVQGVKLYSAPNNDSYVGTITSFSNDILDERGKKTKAVYISGGKNDGWYKRSEVGLLYVRNDDPCLPSGRYAAESMGID